MNQERNKRTKKPLPGGWEDVATEEMRKWVERQDKDEEEPPIRKKFGHEKSH